MEDFGPATRMLALHPFILRGVIFLDLSEIQGLSSQLSGLQIDTSQPSEQLEISLKHQYVPYLVQFYTYRGTPLKGIRQ